MESCIKRFSVVLIVALLVSGVGGHAAPAWPPLMNRPADPPEPAILRYWRLVWGTSFESGSNSQLLEGKSGAYRLVEVWSDGSKSGYGAEASYKELQRRPAASPSLTPQQIANSKVRRLDEFDVIAEVGGPMGETVKVAGVVAEIELETFVGQVVVVFTPNALLGGERTPSRESAAKPSTTNALDSSDSIRSPCTDRCDDLRETCRTDALNRWQARIAELQTAYAEGANDIAQNGNPMTAPLSMLLLAFDTRVGLDDARERVDDDVRWCDFLHDLCTWWCG